MIRINLLGLERPKVKSTLAFDPGQYLTVACALVLVAAAVGIGGWYWTLTQSSTQLDTDIATAQQEQARLQTVLAEVRQFEQRRAQLQQRVTLIEQLRGGQSIPVQLLDHVSRSLPTTLWLTALSEKGNEVTIQGRSTTLIELSDFVASLGSTGLLKKPIEILDSKVETLTTPGAQGPSSDLINFTVKAQIAGQDAAAAPGARAGGAAAAPR